MTDHVGNVPAGAWREAAVAAADVVLVWDPETGVAVDADDGTDSVYGVDPEGFAGTSFAALPVGEEADGRALSRAATGDPVTVERHERLDGTEAWVEHTLLPDGNGTVLDVACDVTGHRSRERELEQFASTVAHDLKEPLNTARATLALAGQADGGDYLDDVETVHDRMTELVDEVLTLAKQGDTVGSVEPVDVATAARDAWTTVDAPEADLAVGDDLGTVAADPERLRTLFENLLTNAVRHGGREVNVRVDAVDGGFVVADDGTGVRPSAEDRLFERGFSTTAEGTGFGLAIVGRIARAHGWTVAHDDGERGGARFEVRFE